MTATTFKSYCVVPVSSNERKVAVSRKRKKKKKKVKEKEKEGSRLAKSPYLNPTTQTMHLYIYSYSNTHPVVFCDIIRKLQNMFIQT